MRWEVRVDHVPVFPASRLKSFYGRQRRAQVDHWLKDVSPPDNPDPFNTCLKIPAMGVQGKYRTGERGFLTGGLL